MTAPNKPWLPDHEVSPELARSLIEQQFSQLRPVDVELLGVGWDNTAYCVNHAYVFRFPRRHIAADLIVAECRLLPWIATRLPIAVPVPIFIGQPDERFPWSFAGYRFLSGRTACTLALGDEQRMALAEPLARFLAALHAIPAEEAKTHGAGPDPIGRLDMVGRRPRLIERLAQIARAGLVSDLRPLLTIVDSTVAISADQSQALVHGDLYARHLLIDDGGKLSGVIDWGDIHAGHPAADLMITYGFLPPAAREAFFRVYGPVDASTQRLARFRALDHAAAVAVFAHDIGDRDLLREAITSFSFLTCD